MFSCRRNYKRLSNPVFSKQFFFFFFFLICLVIWLGRVTEKKVTQPKLTSLPIPSVRKLSQKNREAPSWHHREMPNASKKAYPSTWGQDSHSLLFSAAFIATLLATMPANSDPATEFDTSHTLLQVRKDLKCQGNWSYSFLPMPFLIQSHVYPLPALEVWTSF